jgi:hypothetical protein
LWNDGAELCVLLIASLAVHAIENVMVRPTFAANVASGYGLHESCAKLQEEVQSPPVNNAMILRWILVALYFPTLYMISNLNRFNTSSTDIHCHSVRTRLMKK